MLVRAFNVLRQYEEAEAWAAWHRLCAGLAPDGVLVEGTCDEIGRRAVWAALRPGLVPHPRMRGAGRAAGRVAVPETITFAAHLATLPRPSELAERLPKTLIHRNVPGERVHGLLAAFDRTWAASAPQSAFGPRQRWLGRGRAARPRAAGLRRAAARRPCALAARRGHPPVVGRRLTGRR